MLAIRWISDEYSILYLKLLIQLYKQRLLICQMQHLALDINKICITDTHK